MGGAQSNGNIGECEDMYSKGSWQGDCEWSQHRQWVEGDWPDESERDDARMEQINWLPSL